MFLVKVFSPTKLPSRVLKYVGNNSWSVMAHQFLDFWLLSTVFLFVGAEGFDLAAYNRDIYYRYLIGGNSTSAMLYVLVGLVFPLIISYLLGRLEEELSIFSREKKKIR